MTTWKPRKTVGQMVEEAKTRIENLSVEQVEADAQTPPPQPPPGAWPPPAGSPR
jgi:hypothetical protein